MNSRLRRSARVLLFDRGGDILLIRFVAELEGTPFVFWVTPGGEVEQGEADHAAAGRELHEELGIAPELSGPVHEESGGTYTHLGETVRNFDVFFTALCSRSEPQLRGVTPDEIRLMQEARWWSPSELATSRSASFPRRSPRSPGASGPPRTKGTSLRCAAYTTGSYSVPGPSGTLARISKDRLSLKSSVPSFASGE